jgi:hypothetical protein
VELTLREKKMRDTTAAAAIATSIPDNQRIPFLPRSLCPRFTASGLRRLGSASGPRRSLHFLNFDTVLLSVAALYPLRMVRKCSNAHIAIPPSNSHPKVRAVFSF